MEITKEYPFSKVGLDEVKGLKAELQSLIKPIVDSIQEGVYWGKVEVNESEYRARDGFIPYSSNCGGLEIVEIIPKSSESDFKFLEFGEYDCELSGCKENSCECDSEGALDAKLRVWLKFEGIEDGAMQFYLYCGGGNGDAPYFRTNSEITVFEASFEAKSIAGIKRAASKHIKALLKAIK